MHSILDRPYDPITPHILTSYVSFPGQITADGAISQLRNMANLPDISYLYVTDSENTLLGVLPTRRLLSASPETQLFEIMQRELVAIPAHVNVQRALEFFTEHKYLGFPVVDSDNKLVGVIDVSFFTHEVLDLAKRRPIDELFESLGVHMSNVHTSTPWGAFRFRFPWFMATITSGSCCALLSSFFGKTLEESIVLAFFLTLVLGLSESMAVQAMTVAIQFLHASAKPSFRTFVASAIKELAAALLLALGCANLVFAIIMAWYRSAEDGIVIAGSIVICMTGASLIGICIPTILHAMKMNFRIAAGPLSLALTDLFALTSYFTIATLVLRH